MSLRNAPMILFAAVTIGGFGEARAAQDASPGPDRPAMRGLILTLPDAQRKTASARRAARPPALAAPSTDEEPGLKAFLALDPDSSALAPVAGIVYAF